MQINKLNSASYSHISANATATSTRQTKPDDSHGLWREDLQQKLAATRQQVREFTSPLMAEAYKAQHVQRLISAYTGQSNSSRVFENAIESEQKLQRHARNTVLLQAYQESQTEDDIGTRLVIAA
jgi:hypothetical protein